MAHAAPGKPCLACALSRTVAGWIEEVKEHGDEEQLEEATDPTFYAHTFGYMLASSLLNVGPIERTAILDTIFGDIFDGLEEHGVPAAPTHGAPELAQ